MNIEKNLILILSLISINFVQANSEENEIRAGVLVTNLALTTYLGYRLIGYSNVFSNYFKSAEEVFKSSNNKLATPQNARKLSKVCGSPLVKAVVVTVCVVAGYKQVKDTLDSMNSTSK